MGDKNADILFDYLKGILYGTEVSSLDLNDLDPDFIRLGQGLQYLDQAIGEMRDYSAALSMGNLSVNAPGRENPLCENLKNIHANLNHLTWQAKQVAKGDYSQHVSYLGEFSEAFNTMTCQLKDREEALRKEAAIEREYADMLGEYNQQLEIQANVDALTGIGNRNFFREKIGQFLTGQEAFVICYCDLDHLKYVNDNYGHSEGDDYIRGFVGIVKDYIRSKDIFARLGGDEFCIVLRDCPIDTTRRKIAAMQANFAKDTLKPYPKSFSCGIVEVPKDHKDTAIIDILRQADEVMYQQKKEHMRDYPIDSRKYN